MSDYDNDPLDPESQRIVDEASRRSGSTTWQSDPQLQRLLAAATRTQPKVSKGAWQTSPANAQWKAANDALVSYIDQNRARLGIPAGEYVSPATGQVYKPEGTNWLQFGLLYGGGLLGGFGLQAALGGAAAGAGAAGASTAGTTVATGTAASNISYKDFSTFCPKAIAGIGKLPDTVTGSIAPNQTRTFKRKGQAMSLNNAGDEIVLRDSGDVERDRFAYAASMEGTVVNTGH